MNQIGCIAIENYAFGSIDLELDEKVARVAHLQSSNFSSFKNMVFTSGVIAFIFVANAQSDPLQLPTSAAITSISDQLNPSQKSVYTVVSNTPFTNLPPHSVVKVNCVESFYENHDILEIVPATEEAIAMYQKLIDQRTKFEKQGVIVGATLASITLASSIFTSIVPWSASVPAAVMFGSLSMFMLLKKKIRGEHDA